ncbi:hypothetical protein EVA_09345 [gut metagenome]|uniref:Uncharacterized protein n=1 Tax=gut metagenome TaxID=749906 RepID=J9G5T2_9ZZZZ
MAHVECVGINDILWLWIFVFVPCFSFLLFVLKMNKWHYCIDYSKVIRIFAAQKCKVFELI